MASTSTPGRGSSVAPRRRSRAGSSSGTRRPLPRRRWRRARRRQQLRHLGTGQVDVGERLLVGVVGRERPQQLVEHLRRRQVVGRELRPAVRCAGSSRLTAPAPGGSATSIDSNPTRRTSLRSSIAGRRGDPRADVLDDGPHVGGRAALRGLDEVGVLLRHPGRADAVAAQAEAVDQTAGPHLAGHGVDEHRAAVLTAGLVLASPPDDLGDRRLARVAIARGEPRCGRSTTTWSARVESRGTAGRARRASDDGRRVGVVEVDAASTSTSTVAHVRAVPAGVHPHGPADRAGHADGPLQAGQAGRRGATSQRRQSDGAAGRRTSSPASRSGKTISVARSASVRRSPETRRRRSAGSSLCPRRARGAPTAGHRARRPTKQLVDVRGRANRAAGPPTRYVAARPSGSSRLHSPSTRRHATASDGRGHGRHDDRTSRGGRGSPPAAWQCRRTPSRCTRRQTDLAGDERHDVVAPAATTDTRPRMGVERGATMINSPVHPGSASCPTDRCP